MLAMTDGLLTTSGLAAALHLHPETVREWVREGKIRPTVRTAGGHARFDLAQVRRQLDEAQGDRKAGEHRARPAQAGADDTPAEQQEWDPHIEGAEPRTKEQAAELVSVIAYHLQRDDTMPRGRRNLMRARINELMRDWRLD